jgi:hypothetical protein
MGAPQVVTSTIDLSQTVPSFPGVIGGIVIPALKGKIGEAVLITSEADLLKYLTPNENIGVGYDNSYWSALAFLQSGNRLYVSRAANTALYGGSIIKNLKAVASSAGIPAGMSNPDSYTFDATAISATAEVNSITCVADVAGSLRGKYFLIASPTVQYYVWFEVSGTGTDPQVPGRTGIKVTITDDAINSVVATAVQTALEAHAAFAATVLSEVVTCTNSDTGTVSYKINAGNSGFTVVCTTDGVTASTSSDAFLIYGINQGAWINNVSIKILTFRDSASTVKTPGSFIIYVYNNGDQVEAWKCSIIEGAKDGDNNNIFIEDVLQQSNYIRAIVNNASILYPKEITTALSCAQGADGSSVTDADMMTAADIFKNETVPLTVFMDGGWATTAYSKYITGICETRQDCVAILSTPYASEASSSFMTDIVAYRQYTQNINSSFAALYTAHVKIYDKFNDRELWVSPDGYVGAAICKTFLNYELWFPVAGFRRGILNVLDVKQRFSKGQMDTLYDTGINMIRFAPGRGILIWGQKTLQANPSALDRLNCRLLLVYIQPSIAEALENFVFEFNDATTRSQITALITDYMANIQSRRGVYGFSVVCDSSNNTAEVIDKNEMEVWLFIQPTKSAETLRFKTIITRSNVTTTAF